MVTGEEESLCQPGKALVSFMKELEEVSKEMEVKVRSNLNRVWGSSLSRASSLRLLSQTLVKLEMTNRLMYRCTNKIHYSLCKRFPLILKFGHKRGDLSFRFFFTPYGKSNNGFV